MTYKEIRRQLESVDAVIGKEIIDYNDDGTMTITCWLDEECGDLDFWRDVDEVLEEIHPIGGFTLDLPDKITITIEAE